MSDSNNPATQALNEALAASFGSGNFSQVGEFYGAESMLLPPRGKALQGRDSITAFWLGFSNRFSGIVFTTADVRLLGDDVARETGTYETKAGSGQAAPGRGKYLLLWEKRGGEWQIESCIWNRSPEGGAGQGEGQGQGARGGIGGGRGTGMPGGGRPGQGQGQGMDGGRGGGGGMGGGMGGGGRGQGPQGQRRGGGGYEQTPGLYSDLEG